MKAVFTKKFWKILGCGLLTISIMWALVLFAQIMVLDWQGAHSAWGWILFTATSGVIFKGIGEEGDH